MKRLLGIILAAICSLGISSAQIQVRYLVNLYKPVQSYCYTSGRTLEIYGGNRWQNGFSIGNTVGPYKAGYATFRLGGKYDTIKFVTGLRKGCSASSTNPCVVTIYADGKKIFDKVLRNYEVHQRVTLDIKGADELRFVLVAGEGEVCFGEVSLWKAGEKPKDTGNITTAKPAKKMLVRDIMPYTIDYNNYTLFFYQHSLVHPKAKQTSVKLGNTTYNYGLLLNMKMALSGNNEGQTHFNLDGRYSTLDFIAGPVNTANSANGKGWIVIKGDGKILHEYEIRQDDIAKRITVDVSGVRQLSVFSEQSEQSLYGAIVDAWVYPEGEQPQRTATAESTVSETDARLAQLPDVCKLISNIPPYALRSSVDKQLYTGESDYITFSMGGVRFSEGFILYRKANFMDDNVVSYAAFDLGNQFDYVSFVTGYVGKSWVMNNDKLRVFADDKLIYETPLYATCPNQKVVLPIDKCRKLRFENGGQTTMDVGAYGVADLVVYRGEPVENSLFEHPVPECPHETDLIDLCKKPYLHYVSTARENVFFDGSTQRNYFPMKDGRRINKGFLLQTSTHFSLDYGVLAGKTGTGATAAIGAAAVGASFVVAGSVGGALIGSTLAGVAPMLVLAAGGEAVENSCIAFNTYGQYNTLTFTVACFRSAEESQLLGPDTYQVDKKEYKETLLIGADQKVVAELALFEAMQPQTVTVPIEACHQLLFWLSNTNGNSAQFVFYDLHLSKDTSAAVIPEDVRSTQAIVSYPAWSVKESEGAFWPRQKSTGAKVIDKYYVDLACAGEKAERCLKTCMPSYEICTYYLQTDAGQTCKAVKLRHVEELPDETGAMHPTPNANLSLFAGGYGSITRIYENCGRELAELDKLKNDLSNLKIAQASAYTNLVSLGFGAIAQGRVLKRSSAVLSKLSKLVNAVYAEKMAEFRFLDALIKNAVDIDGRQSSEQTIFCPLFEGDIVPEGDKMMVRNFTL